MKLIHIKTLKELKIGDPVTTFKNEIGILEFFKEPYKISSTGKVYIKFLNSTQELFPRVIGAKFVDENIKVEQSLKEKLLLDYGAEIIKFN